MIEKKFERPSLKVRQRIVKQAQWFFERNERMNSLKETNYQVKTEKNYQRYNTGRKGCC
jgi:hypothetical protein